MGLNRWPPSVPAPRCSAARRREHPTSGWWDIDLLILPTDDLPSLDSQQPWQGGKLPHPLLPLLHLPRCGSKPNLPPAVSIPIFGQTPPCYESIQLGSAQCRGVGGSVCGKGRGGCRSGLIWPGTSAEFSRTVCTVSSLYNGYV